MLLVGLLGAALAPASAHAAVAVVQGERVLAASQRATVRTASGSEGRKALLLGPRGGLVLRIEGSVQRLAVRVRAVGCGRTSPRLRARHNGVVVGQQPVRKGQWIQLRFAVPAAQQDAKLHTFSMVADRVATGTGRCAGGVLVDWAAARAPADAVPRFLLVPAPQRPLNSGTPAPAQPAPTPPAPGPGESPVPGGPPGPEPVFPQVDVGPVNVGGLFRDPFSPAALQERAWRDARTNDAATLRRIADQPQAVWVRSADDVPLVDSALDRAQGARVVIALDAIPGRDCLPYRFTSAERLSYPALVDDLAAVIAGRPAIVIVEPRGVVEQQCFTAALASDRSSLLTSVIDTVGALTATRVYLDAGASGRGDADEIASRLDDAGVANADGISLGVGGFATDATEAAYGRELATRIGGKKFVIDSSRNGNGPPTSGDLCNPPSARIGRTPTLSPGIAGADALLWVKRPGESDGPCGGHGAAGTWEPDLALALAGAL